jgi:hypothetical protein
VSGVAAKTTLAGGTLVGDKTSELVKSGVSVDKMIDGFKSVATGSIPIVTEGYNSASKALKESGLTTKGAIEAYMEGIITITVGDWFTMKNVVITDVSSTLNAQQPGAAGGVMSASVSVSFRPMFTLTTEDLENLLRGAPSR